MCLKVGNGILSVRELRMYGRGQKAKLSQKAVSFVQRKAVLSNKHQASRTSHREKGEPRRLIECLTQSPTPTHYWLPILHRPSHVRVEASDLTKVVFRFISFCSFRTSVFCLLSFSSFKLQSVFPEQVPCFSHGTNRAKTRIPFTSGLKRLNKIHGNWE